MVLWLLLAILLLWLAGAAGWLWLCAGLRHEGWRGRAGRFAVQLSGFSLLAGTLAGSPLIALAGAAFPPSALLLLGRILSAPALAAALAPWVIGTTLAAGLGAIALLRFRGFSAVWAPGIALLAGAVSLVVVGDSLTLRAMCAEAAGHRASSFQRNSFLWSLRHARRAFNFEVHALSDHEGTWRIWSYREMAWVVLPPGVAGNIDPPRQKMACAASG